MSGHAKRPCETYLILECVDPTEYAVLNDASKDGLRLILSCGTINTSPGSILREYLYEIFPNGVTKEALDDLFSPSPVGEY